MSKIEEFKKAKGISERVKRAVECTLGRDDPARNDKHHVSVHFAGLNLSAPFQPMQFSIDCSYGYYGSSSGYAASSPELGAYLARAIEMHSTTLLDCAAGLAAKDAETARKAAEDEARNVLQETAA
jgi:hypothetical protein